MAIQFDNTNTGVATLKPATSGTLTLTLPSADGTTGQALTTDGSGQLAFSTVGGGGLTGFTAAESTSAPNATVYVDSLTSSAASTNADVAFVAKGTGATLAQIPDSTTTGGNKRGQYATDLQKSRSAATQVAAANYSVILGGERNSIGTTFCDYSIVVGGYNNSIASYNQYGVIIGGSNNSITNTNSSQFLGGGSNNNTNNSYAVVVGGFANTATGTYSAILGGASGTTRVTAGLHVFPACAQPISGTAGVSQSALLILARQTTDATATVLRSNTSAASTTNQVILPNNSAYYFRGEIVAGVTGAGDTKGWYVEGVIKRGANAASTALVGTPTVTSNYADAGASTWSIAVTADTTNGGLKVEVTGQAATTIRWVAQIRTTEMTY